MKKAVIFGHTSGLGEAITLKLLGKGWKVVGVARHEDQNSPDNLFNIAADLAAKHQVEHAAQQVAELHGDFDLIIYCAGTLTSHSIDELDYDEMLRMFRVNTFAPMVIESRLFNTIKANGADVVNITSDSVVKSYPDYHEYAASKIALQKFTSDLQQALASTECRVIDFCSSGFQSNMRPNMTGKKAVRNEAIYPKADEVAELIIQLLELPKKIEVEKILTHRKDVG